MIKRILFIFGAVFFTTGLCQSQAGDGTVPTYKETTTVDNFPYQKGTVETQLLAGSFFSFTPDSSQRKTIDIAYQNLRVGYMFNTPGGGGVLRGNFEMLIEAFGGESFVGSPGGLGGGSLLFRYNFVQPNTFVVPYLQLGGGCLGNDIYKDNTQRSIGEAFEFNLQAHVGLQFLLSKKVALTLEGGYTHISNADLAPRNVGLDAFGFLAGVTVFF